LFHLRTRATTVEVAVMWQHYFWVMECIPAHFVSGNWVTSYLSAISRCCHQF